LVAVENGCSVLEYLHQLRADAKAVGVLLDALEDIPVVMPFACRLPVAKHFKQIEQVHVIDAVGVMLGLSAVSPVSATRHQAISMEIARSLADNIQVNIQKRYNPIAQGVSQADRIELMRRRLAAFKAQLATVA